ncbi:unnamed protein product [Diamesa serratosioi]
MSEQVEATEFEKVLNKTISPSKIREALLDNEYLSDVIFQLADGEELKAHKMFLITSSTIFHKLFSDHTEDVIQLNLEWINKQTMLEVCRFIYSDILNLNETNMMEIFSAAVKLEMKYLLEKTIEFICKTLNVKTVFNVLQTNLKHKDFRLNMRCFEYIAKNPKKCLETEEFLDLPLEILKIMLQTCKLPNNLATVAVLRWEMNNLHEDIDELVSSLSLNEGSAPDEKSNESDSDESTISRPSPPDAPSNGAKKKENHPRNETSRNRNDRRRKDKKPEGGVGSVSIPNRKLRRLIQQQKYVNFYGPLVRKAFKFANLEIEFMSKDVIIQGIRFINDLENTDKEFEIWISESNDYELRHTFNDKVSISNGKLNGQYIRYILPNKNRTLKANRKYWIRVEFKQDEFRQTYAHYKVAGNSGADRIKLILDEPLKVTAQIITSLTFVDA